MVRVITQILVGLALFFGAVTLIPKCVVEFRRKNFAKGMLFFSLGLLALFFAGMAFYYAYLTFASA